MIASPPSNFNYLRNDRLKAARDRQLAATVVKLRRISVGAGFLTVFIAGGFWFYGCSLSDGCTSTPMAALEAEVVGNLVPGN